MTDTPNGGHTPPGGYAAYLTGRLESLGLSRNALARALGHRGASQVSRWCAGKAVPREKARARIEAELGMVEHRHEAMRADIAAAHVLIDGELARQTPQDAPGSPIPGGEGYEGTPLPHGPNMLIVTDESYGIGSTVERYVVEGG